MAHDPAKDIALVKDGAVVQVAFAPCDPASFGEAPDGELIDFAPGQIVPGKLWDGTSLSDPSPIVTPPSVPQVVEKRKLKLEMLATPWPPASPTTTLLAFVNAAVASGSEALQIEWSDANYISRTRDLVLGMKAAAQAATGLSDAEGDALMDQLFTNANARP